MTAEEFDSQFTNGDVIVVQSYISRTYWIVLLCGLGEEEQYFPGMHPILYHAVLDLHGGRVLGSIEEGRTGIGWVEESPSIRRATNEEKDLLFKNLEREGYEWDDNNLRLLLTNNLPF